MEVLPLAALLFDVPDDPAIVSSADGGTPFLIAGVVIAAAVLIYVFFIRRKKLS